MGSTQRAGHPCTHPRTSGDGRTAGAREAVSVGGGAFKRPRPSQPETPRPARTPPPSGRSRGVAGGHVLSRSAPDTRSTLEIRGADAPIKISAHTHWALASKATPLVGTPCGERARQQSATPPPRRFLPSSCRMTRGQRRPPPVHSLPTLSCPDIWTGSLGSPHHRPFTIFARRGEGATTERVRSRHHCTNAPSLSSVPGRSRTWSQWAQRAAASPSAHTVFPGFFLYRRCAPAKEFTELPVP